MQTSTDKYIILSYEGLGEGWEILEEYLTVEQLRDFFLYNTRPVRNLEVIKGTWLSYEDTKTLYEEAKKENK